MTTTRIFWQQRRATFKEHFYAKDDDELYWETYSRIVHSFNIHKPARAIIVPNIGWRYCAKVQAKAYRQMNPTNIKRIFILAPILNYFCPKKCCLASLDSYLNPIFRICVDQQSNDKYIFLRNVNPDSVIGELESTKLFARMTWKKDEEELTIEAQLPFITTLLLSMRGKFTIVPVYVGALGLEEQQIYGAIFSKYFNDAENFFIFSLNFHHWGKYFNFTHRFPKDKTVIETLDKLLLRGIEAIQPLNPEKFMDYCLFTPGKFVGRHIIGILIYAIQTFKNREIEKINELDEEERNKVFYTKFQLKFLDKGVSHPDCTDEDHCFSFCSASLTMSRVKLIPDEPIPDGPLDKRQ